MNNQPDNSKPAGDKTSILASGIEAGNAPLPPHVGKLIANAPVSDTPERRESCVVASLVADFPEAPAVLPRSLGRFLADAPESCDDARNGKILKAVRECLANGEAVNLVTVCRRLDPPTHKYLHAVISDTLPISCAEAEAETLLAEYRVRQAKTIFSEALSALESSPGSARIIAGNAKAALAGISKPADSLLDRLKTRLYSAEAKPEEPEARFSVAGIPICTPGNLTTISAHAKAGKSAAIGAMIASAFALPDADCLGFTSSNPHGGALIHIDTEQSPFDYWELIQRSLRRAKVDKPPAWLRSYCLTGFSPADVRRSIRLLTEQAAKQFGGIHSILLDGTADAAHDVNDPAESNSLTTEVHALAIEFSCPLINIIHVNPGSDFKTRGHLGSQLERKSETNLRLEKDAHEITVIWADKNRRAPIPKATGPRFAWNPEAGMHLTIASQRSAKDEAEKKAMQIEAEAVFSAAKNTQIRHGQFIKFLMKEVQASESTAKRRFVEMLRTQIIRKEQTGFYALANK